MLKEFCKPWMKKCNPHLIYRYWVSKDCPGKLTIKVFGVNIQYFKTPFGIPAVKVPGDRSILWH